MTLDELQFRLLKLQFGTTRRAHFYDKLATLLDNGIPDIQALQTMHNIASEFGKKPGDLLPTVLRECIRATSAGHSLASGLRRWIPDAEYMVIEAGQTTGANLIQSLRDAITLTQSQAKIRGAIAQSVSTPAITLLSAFGLLLFNKMEVFPAFAKLVPPARWTGLPGAMYWVTNWLGLMGPLLGLLLIASLAAYFYTCPRLTGPFRAKADRHLPYSLYRLLAANAFLTALAALLRAGMNDVQALETIRKRANPYLVERIDAINRQLRGGAGNIGEAMQRAGFDFPDREIVEDLRVYSGLKGLAESLSIISRDWLKVSLERLQSFAGKNEMIGKLGLAAMIITFASAQVLLQQQITAAVSSH